jgi:hypothetical protein
VVRDEMREVKGLIHIDDQMVLDIESDKNMEPHVALKNWQERKVGENFKQIQAETKRGDTIQKLKRMKFSETDRIHPISTNYVIVRHYGVFLFFLLVYPSPNTTPNSSEK